MKVEAFHMDKSEDCLHCRDLQAEIEQEQFTALSNTCAYIQESVEILKFMVDKINSANGPSTSSSSARAAAVDSHLEASNARHISHITID